MRKRVLALLQFLFQWESMIPNHNLTVVMQSIDACSENLM